ncbi:5-formyltetrahydrofolate cyclo-ligase [Caligus rogercresseyi]|uniref:5-formyltetrahydrofolate cyclo-ligase n=1 Tax=Caligus rogercresseyi TaxID=217165 RepID=A0A7T8GPW0_CALRO|nr:5-formyltetrahydrofolate cyclo-ligase [Caligus rogercresseyi]
MVETLRHGGSGKPSQTSWHIKQPPSGENTHREIAKEIDLIIVPGLAFSLAENAWVEEWASTINI